ncbi:hypothetical protein M8C21_021839 [Ambrosia artemisiifolia]|uniref:10 kDa chaperonin, mitochondrial n=1 Tax=Ambrosia artemisiifolia TaxID=4212 RepID=A0AAD5CIV7_AMBAR|nr:hypothetical protein M8C21_021839 [Ambrosia artemisiifolia]
MAKRLIPLFNRVLVEKIIPPSKTTAGILLPEKASTLNSGKVIAVGTGTHDLSGNKIPVGVKEGDTVLLPEYGGTEVKLGEKEYLETTGKRNDSKELCERVVYIELDNVLLRVLGIIYTGMRTFWELCMIKFSQAVIIFLPGFIKLDVLILINGLKDLLANEMVLYSKKAKGVNESSLSLTRHEL